MKVNFILWVISILATPALLLAQDPGDLSKLNIEQLMDIEVTSASKSEQKIGQVAAAIHVVTNQEIRRSGASSIPEALRLVPGLQVGQVNSSVWAISSRGFNSVTANKLLVMIDGRTIYTPIFSGVFWDAHDLVLDDIDRIEVIRGPGGTLWGANAVNGVINIITKNARQTEGKLITAGMGNELLATTSLRQGGKLAEQSWYRIYAKGNKWDSSKGLDGHQNFDEMHSLQSGFRTDLTLSPRDQLNLQGDIFGLREELRTRAPSMQSPYNQTVSKSAADTSAGNILAKWQRQVEPGSQLTTQLYFDRFVREFTVGGFYRNTIDFDLQYNLQVNDGHELTLGSAYRWITDHTYTDTALQIDPEDRDYDILSAFIQDQISLIPEKLYLTLGSKIEHNDYSGSELQPSARLSWSPNQRYSSWAAVSRAVRTPSRLNHDFSVDGLGFPTAQGSPGVLRLYGDESFDSEELIAYELGQRIQLSQSLFLDLSTFINDYDQLLSLKNTQPFVELAEGAARVVNPYFFDNSASGQTYGAEIFLEWQASAQAKFSAGYSYLDTDIEPSSLNNQALLFVVEGQNAHNYLMLRASLDLPYSTRFDANWRYVDSLSSSEVGQYSELDLQLAWSPRPNLELALVGKNLLDNSHQEFPTTFLFGESGEVERAILGKVTWQF